MKHRETNKVGIIGAGFVGATTAFSLMVNGLVSELVVIDINQSKAEGEVMDLNHGLPFARPINIYAGSYEDLKGADVVIITAGSNIKANESRLELVDRNTKIFKDIIPQVVKYAQEAILLVVSNPVDVMTYFTWKVSGFPVHKVIGSGTVLDTARYKYLIGELTGVDSRNVHGYIIGEHGDSEVAAWSSTTIAGVPIRSYCDNAKYCSKPLNKEQIADDVKNLGYQIIERKNYTSFAVALAVNRIVEAILRDENAILTVSSLMQGKYGLTDVALSVPSIVNRNGVERLINVPLEDEELKKLQNSGKLLKEIIARIKF